MPFFGDSFIPYTLEQLAALSIYKTRYEHIHDCAMQVVGLEQDAMQPAIMDYIIEHETDESLPIFLLEHVPIYVEGYNKALLDQFARCERHECICCGMGNNG